MILNEEMYKVLEKAQKITWVDYISETKQFINEDKEHYIEPVVLINVIEDLLCEIDKQKEEYEDRIKYLKEETDPNINYYEEKLIREAEERGEM